LAALIQVLRNSIGDITAPTYGFWMRVAGRGPEEVGLTAVQGIMIFLVWATFIYNLVFNLIMMMNFLIAIVSQSWDQVQEDHAFQLYESRVAINCSTSNIMNAFGIHEIEKDSELVILRGNVRGMGVDKGQLGLYRAVKQTTRKGFLDLKYELTTNINKVDMKVEKLR